MYYDYPEEEFYAERKFCLRQNQQKLGSGKKVYLTIAVRMVL